MSRTLRRGALVAAVAAGIVLATPAVASAHVGVSPDQIPQGTSTLLTFSFSHGCEGSPTTALRITMPEGTAAVSPTFDAAWNTEVEKGADGYVSTITYTAVRPVPNELRGAVSLSFRPTEDAPDQLAFPVEQLCETGESQWVQVAEEGENPEELEHPAPIVAVSGMVSDDGHHGHGDAPSSDHGDHGDDGADAAEAEDSASVVPVVLGSAGLAAGIAALIVSIAAYRRRS